MLTTRVTNGRLASDCTHGLGGVCSQRMKQPAMDSSAGAAAAGVMLARDRGASSACAIHLRACVAEHAHADCQTYLRTRACIHRPHIRTCTGRTASMCICTHTSMIISNCVYKVVLTWVAAQCLMRPGTPSVLPAAVQCSTPRLSGLHRLAPMPGPACNARKARAMHKL